MFLKQRKKFGVLKIEEYTKGGIFMKKQGFTLAEVLITLVIIGIIAAMTLPSLLGGTNKQEIKTGLQKAVSALSQAITLHYALTGEDFSSLDTTSVLEFAGQRLSTKGELSDSHVQTQDGIIYNFSNITGSCANPTSACSVIVDVNGSKGPNALTTDSAANLGDIKDQFTLKVYGTNVVTQTMSLNTTSGGVDYSNTAASMFLDDCYTTSGNKCQTGGSEDGGT